jgi:hypothetical protein
MKWLGRVSQNEYFQSRVFGDYDWVIYDYNVNGYGLELHVLQRMETSSVTGSMYVSLIVYNYQDYNRKLL